MIYTNLYRGGARYIMKCRNKRISLIIIVILLIYIIPNSSNAKASGKVQLNRSNITLIVGNDYSLLLENATSKVTWKTSDKSVAMISNKGKISAKKAGTATITAKYNGKFYKCKVTVVKVYLNHKSITMNFGSKETLKLVNAKAQVAWFSSNKEIVYIKDNIVEAKSVGNATITAKCNGKAYTCKITVKSGEYKTIQEQGVYTSKDKVAKYINAYHKLPLNYITKSEAADLGWTGGSLLPYAPYRCIGGDEYIDFEDKLPNKEGRIYYECDINTLGSLSRGEERLVYSNDGLLYYTSDHYETFEQIEFGSEQMMWRNVIVGMITPITCHIIN